MTALPAPQFSSVTLPNQIIPVRAFILPSDADATAGISRAVAAALAVGAPVVIYFAPGNYNISGRIPITTAANQGIYLRGEAASCTTITQTADADGVVVNLTNYGSGLFGGGAFAVSGLAFKMTAASTSRTALAVSTTASSGAAGAPLSIDDITLVSPSPTALWGTGISLAEIANIANISRVNSIYSGTAAGTAIAVSGDSTSYSSGIYLRDSTFISGNIAVSLGNYLQGVHINNLNTINTLYSVNGLQTAGINEEIQIVGSYLDGKFILSPTGSAVLNSVKIIGCYFDFNELLAGDSHVTINNVPVLALVGNTLNGPLTAVANITGLSLSSPNVTQFNTVILGNTIQAYGSSGSLGVSLAASTSGIIFDSTVFINNATDVSDAGAGNTFVATRDRLGAFHLYGMTGSVPTAPALFDGPLQLTPTTPATSSAAGVTGQIAVDASYIYVCTAANTWKRIALTTF